MLSDRLPVTDQGVTIPKVWFGDATQVELRRDQGAVVVQPVDATMNRPTPTGPAPPDDPLWRLCSIAIDLDVPDVSADIDRYLYDTDE
jgi:hypothetical protein